MTYILNTKSQSQTLFLSTSKCLSREPYVWGFNTPIRCPGGLKMVISLQEFTIANVFFNVSDFNNQISILTSTNTTYTIPPGRYSAISFKDQINELLIGTYITCIYNMQLFKYSFVNTIYFEIINTEAFPTTCSELIGTNKDNENQYEYPIVASTPSFTILMPSCVDFSGTPYIFLKVANLSFSNLNSEGVINNTMARIPINSPVGYKIFYRPTEPIKFVISNYSINNLSLFIEDIHNNPIDIQGNEFQVLIKIDYILDPPDVDGMEGTLDWHIKNLPIKEEVEVDEDEPILF